jgi:predicted transcriptional regulator
MPQYVKDWMTKTILTIEADCLLSEVIDLLCQHNEQFLFYEDENKNIFVLTNCEIKQYSPLDPTQKVIDLMSPVTCFASSEWTLEQALEIMQNEELGYLPVKDENKILAGVLSIEAFFIAVQEIKWKLDSDQNLTFFNNKADLGGMLTNI